MEIFPGELFLDVSYITTSTPYIIEEGQQNPQVPVMIIESQRSRARRNLYG